MYPSADRRIVPIRLSVVEPLVDSSKHREMPGDVIIVAKDLGEVELLQLPAAASPPRGE
jgi:hypothetical protein